MKKFLSICLVICIIVLQFSLITSAENTYPAFATLQHATTGASVQVRTEPGMNSNPNSQHKTYINNGEIVKDGSPSEVFTNAIELKKYGLELPRATYIAEELSSLGVNVKKGILTEKDLLEELCVLFQKG